MSIKDLEEHPLIQATIAEQATAGRLAYELAASLYRSGAGKCTLPTTFNGIEFMITCEMVREGTNQTPN